MRVLNSLGEVERKRGNSQAALSWIERSLERAQRRDSVDGQARARSNRAILLSNEAPAAADRDTRRKLLSQAMAFRCPPHRWPRSNSTIPGSPRTPPPWPPAPLARPPLPPRNSLNCSTRSGLPPMRDDVQWA